MKEEKIEIDKSTLRNWAIGILALLLVISLITGGFGINSNKEKNLDYKANLPPTQEPINMNNLIDDDDIKGDINAPVTIVAFSDYECPFCARFHTQTYNLIKENYIDTGKVRFVYRDFPLNFHANAQKAAEAAECAGEQGKYYEMSDKLFEEGVSGGVDSYKKYAIDLNLNSNEFDKCLDSGKMASEVNKDLNDGQKIGVSGTPAFFINGEFISGAQPYSVFEAAIKNALQ